MLVPAVLWFAVICALLCLFLVVSFASGLFSCLILVLSFTLESHYQYAPSTYNQHFYVLTRMNLPPGLYNKNAFGCVPFPFVTIMVRTM